MGNTLGRYFRITTFGESHGKSIGVVIDGLPAALKISTDLIQKELNRRKPCQSPSSSSRKEEDKVEVLSGVFEGKSTGAPLCMLVYNRDIQSQDYEALKTVFRPGHADYTYAQKYGIRDYRGGGRASARETVARVIAGAIAKQELGKLGVKIIGYVTQLHTIIAEHMDYKMIEQNPIRCPDRVAAKKMEKLLLNLKNQGDSVGGVVEVIATQPPAGLGEPVFDKLDAELAKALMSLPAVKGVEIGEGFRSTKMKGSEFNDILTPDGFRTNHQGGILGGISTGQNIIVRAAFKPVSSIDQEQDTIDTEGRPIKIRVGGRHDTCVLPRAVPIVEAMVAIVLYDAWLGQHLFSASHRRKNFK